MNEKHMNFSSIGVWNTRMEAVLRLHLDHRNFKGFSKELAFM
jgi:hypothetical protein